MGLGFPEPRGPLVGAVLIWGLVNFGMGEVAGFGNLIRIHCEVCDAWARAPLMQTDRPRSTQNMNSPPLIEVSVPRYEAQAEAGREQGTP